MTDVGAVAIVGAGQIGTMLGQALTETAGGGGGVALYDRDPAVARASLALGSGSAALERAEQVLEAGTIILAVPVDQIVAWLREWGGRLEPDSLLLDTGSAKLKVVEAMRAHVGPEVHALGGHPICGTETSGPSAARREALLGATFALTPVRDDQVALERATALVRRVGALPVQISCERHDRILARSSHLPHLLASALALVCARVDDDRPTVRAMIGPGFAGTSRLAEAEPGMVASFGFANATELAEALAEFGHELGSLAQALGAGEGSLRDALAAGAEARRELLERPA